MSPGKRRRPLLICFPFAGGSSRLFVDWKNRFSNRDDDLNNNNGNNDDDEDELSNSNILKYHDIELPGRLTRAHEDPMTSATELADLLVQEILQGILPQQKQTQNTTSDNDGEEGIGIDEDEDEDEDNEPQSVILFGHSFGAIIAYEVSKRLENIQTITKNSLPVRVIAVFVSASPPPHLQLTKNNVSEMDAASMIRYFESRGYTLPSEIVQDPESMNLFLRTVKADYKVLETFHSYNSKNEGKEEEEEENEKDQMPQKLNAPLYVLGGAQDTNIPEHQLRSWKDHTTGPFQCHTYKDQGHYYVTDTSILKDIGNRFALAAKIYDPALRDQVRLEDSTKKKVALVFRKVLALDNKSIIHDDTNFFTDLGVTSLDTMALTTEFKNVFDIHITQNEFIMHPSLLMLSKRIIKIKQESTGIPMLEDIDGSVSGISGDDTQWFQASPGQEQMLSCWETAPSVYNMPTTIEIHGTLDLNILRKAFQAVVERQPVLRTILKIDSSTNHVLQKVLASCESCFELTETVVDSEKEAQKVIETDSVRIFDLTKPPLVRGLVVHTPKSHLLLLNQHHVGSDGWSRTQLRIQLLQTYLKLRENRPLSAIRPHPNYIDWTMWNRRWLHEYGQKQKQISYWKRKLEGLSALDLPLDFPRPSVLSVEGMRIGISIDADLTQRFIALTARENANPFVGLLSVYMILLHRWGGGDDFAIGIALANRHHEGIADRIGYFANEVAVRAELSQSPSFREVLQTIRSNVMEGMANADVPFHEVTEYLKLPRDRSRTSVFQAMFALQERDWHTLDDLNPPPAPNCGESDIKFNLKQFAHNTSKFEVHMQLRYNGKGGLEGDFHIATDLFTPETGHRLVEGYRKLMECCIGDPNIPVAFHPITPEEDLKLSVISNSTNVQYEKKSLFDRLEGNPPNNIAFRCQDGRSQTYGEYIDVSQYVSKRLYHSHGVKTGDRVGLLMKNSIESMDAILGIVRLGCSHVIVDPAKTPLDRCEMIFEDAGTKVILADNDNTFDDLMLRGFTVVKWDSLTSEYSQLGQDDMEAQFTNPVFQMQDEDTFGIYYTSGTTGKPKGVVITMSNVYNLSSWWQDFFSLNQTDRVLLFSSLSFIMSLRQWIPTLCAGATVIIPSCSVEFESAIRTGKVNKLVCTPSALSSLDISVASNIDSLQVAGETPQIQVLKAWNVFVKDIFIGLGPTELCAHALCSLFDGECACIGYPAGNVRAYIVNPESGLEQPVNVVGELWIAGANVAKGYHNRTKETNKHFVTDPFQSDKNAKLYKVGDLAKRMPDGRIMFVGRGDKQIKVNGFRIETTEIANSMPSSVRRSHIMVDDGQLVAFVMPEVKKSDILSTLEKTLPTYMIPKVIVPLPKFPLNKNGKIHTESLINAWKNLEKTHVTAAADDRSPIERKIHLVWMQLLRISNPAELKVFDNFFEKGGTSLSAVVLSRKLSKELQTEVTVQDIFAHQTIQSFATSLESSSIQTLNPPGPLRFLPGGRESLNPWAFGMLQGIGLIFMSLLAVGPAIATVSISLRAFLWFGHLGFLLFPLFLVSGCTFHMLLSLCCKWIIIGRYRPGKAKLYSWMFLKWWLVRRILHVTGMYTWIIDETNLSRWWLSLLGANVGRNVSVEQPFLLEPDLVSIGDDCVLEFEVQLATAEIVERMLELRPVKIGNRVKLGVRSVVLGGSSVHDGCHLLAKTSVDSTYSSTGSNQVISGSPGKVDGATAGDIWRPRYGELFTALQIVGSLLQLLVLEASVYPAAALGIFILERFGNLALIAYLGSAMQLLAALTLMIVMICIRRALVPQIVPGRVYSSASFAMKKWFLDRLFLSPIFSYASQRTLQTSSTFPIFLRLLGSKVGKKAWINHPYMRLGAELLHIGDSCHMGMLSYVSTQSVGSDGVSFSQIRIGDHSSFGQRCVVLAGSWIGDHTTIGAETILPTEFTVPNNGSSFGSPPVLFSTSASSDEITKQTQDAAQSMLENRSFHNEATTAEILLENIHKYDESDELGSIGNSREPQQRSEALKIPQRRQDVGKGNFWMYVTVTLILQALIPLLIGVSYAAIYFATVVWIGDITIEMVLVLIPCVYIIGSMILMLNLKLMQMCGGSFRVGTTDFFSWRFFYWHAFADLVYLCTSTVIYPFSGTQLYCRWLRFMGARVGQSAFISPENGGFREIDFLDIGDDAVLMTPNIHAHYTDHGKLQFSPVTIEKGATINVGATIMPLTQYGEHCRLRPFSVTVKGQHCAKDEEYWGNPCGRVAKFTEPTACLFPGQGSQYPGMLHNNRSMMQLATVEEMLAKATRILGFDVSVACAPDTSMESLAKTEIAQPVLFVAGLACLEYVRHYHPLEASKSIAYSGFSLGEITALCAAGGVSFEDGLLLVQKRAKAMQECCDRHKGGSMCNIRGLCREKVNSFCEQAGCAIANIICDHQDKNLVPFNIYVCAGSEESIDALVDAVSQHDNALTGLNSTARLDLTQYSDNSRYRMDTEIMTMAVPSSEKKMKDSLQRCKASKLKVAGAFHTGHMKDAQKAFRRAVEETPMVLPTECLIYSNVTGRPYESVEQMKKLLVTQLTSPVQWYDSIRDMMDNYSIHNFLECGPMDQLRKMQKCIDATGDSGETMICCDNILDEYMA